MTDGADEQGYKEYHECYACNRCKGPENITEY